MFILFIHLVLDLSQKIHKPGNLDAGVQVKSESKKTHNKTRPMYVRVPIDLKRDRYI